MTFTLISPQKARNSSGYIVQVANRHAVEYIEPHRKAVFPVDFGRTVGLYGTADVSWDDGITRTSMGASEKAEIASRVKAGLEAMGSVVELI